MNSRLRAAVLGVVACGAIAVGACSQAGASTSRAKQSKHITIGFVVKTFNGTPVWTDIVAGAQTEAKKLGVTLKVEAGSSEEDVTGQINKIQDVLSSGVNALAVAPNGTTQVTPTLNGAVKKHIPVVIIDTSVPNFHKAASFIGGNEALAGTQMAQAMVKALGSKAKGAQIGILNYPGNSTLAERIGAAVKVFKAAGVDIVAQLPSDCALSTSENSVQNMLTAHPQLAGVFGGCGNGAAGAVQAAKAAHTHLIITGIDGLSLEFQAIKSGDELETELQNFAKMGAETVLQATRAAEGKKVTKNVLIPDTVITKQNVSKYKPAG